MTLRIRPATPVFRGLLPRIGAFALTLLLAAQASGGDVCGDGSPGVPAEECDDGNTTSGDGCSAECLIEGPLDDTQARCVSAVNKAFAGAIAQANRTALRCLKDIAAGRSNEDFADCTRPPLLEPALGRVERAQAKQCEAKGVEAGTTFAYLGEPDAVTQAAVGQALSAHESLLGTPDAIDPRGDRAAARCQRAVAAGLARYLGRLASETAKRKKQSLGGEAPPALSSELAQTLAAVPSSPRVAQALAKLISATARSCEGEALEALFPGGCGESAGSAESFALCVAALGRCSHCRALNDVDRLRVDCGDECSLPDLVAGLVVLDPATPSCAQTFTVGLDVTNEGPASSPSAGTVSLVDVRAADESPQATTVGGFPALISGQTFRVNMPLTVSVFPGETHRITLEVDPGGAIRESSGVNNRRVVEYVLAQGACP